MMIIIIKAIIGWLILMTVGSNLIGLIVRSMAEPVLGNDVDDPFLNRMKSKHKRTGIFFAILFSLVSILYFYLLYHYWNIGVVIAAAMVMFSRIPDLLFEMKTGKKITFVTMPKNPIDYFTTVIQWVALPLLWYSLYCMK